MPGAFADESTGSTTGLENCSLLKALCFWFACLLYNFPDPLGVAGRDTHVLFPPESLLSGLGGASKLRL